MKRKTAKEILAESFRELAGSKPVDRIKVQEIADNCGYSPATFYRHFKDKYDLIAWTYTSGVSSIMDRIDGDRYSWKQSLLDVAMYFWKEKELLSNLFLHTSGHDSFIRYMTEINSNELMKFIRKSEVPLRPYLVTEIPVSRRRSGQYGPLTGKETNSPK